MPHPSRWRIVAAFSTGDHIIETRTIGSLEVSAIGLGCNNFGWGLDAAASAAVIDAAIDAGITFFDTADVYGATKSEEYLGAALGKRRNRVVIATKFGLKLDDERGGAHPDYVRRAVEDSLRRLDTDYIDLFQLHRPDPAVPIAETLGALDELVRSGRVREIGCSNFSAAQLREALATAPPGAARFASVQNEYNLLNREESGNGVLAACERAGIAFLPYFPLASGLLSGKYRRGAVAPPGTRLGGGATLDFSRLLTAENLALVEELVAFAESHRHTLLELAFSWLLAHDVVASVIAGATKPEQVRANAAAAAWRMHPGEMAALEEMLGDRTVKTS